MILPLPVPPGCPENAVRFINLEAYPEYFTDMDALFPAPMTLGVGPSRNPIRTGRFTLAAPRPRR
jgi:hypothetical protein